MAGERIIEALDLADAERAQPPDAPRNPVLAALDQGPEEYVLRVVEKVSSTALHDALLVLPFANILSLMVYLNEWAQRVRAVPRGVTVFDRAAYLFLVLGLEHRARAPNFVLHPSHTPQPDRRKPRDAGCADPAAHAPARGAPAAARSTWV